MQAVLLAAGKGSRISKSIQPIPKCTLEIDGEPLIKRTVKLLLSLGIDVTVCVGYKKEYVYKALEGQKVTFYFNPFYDVTNSIASLWFAKETLKDSLIIMNADVYFSEEILTELLENKNDTLMLGDRTRTEIGDYFFTLDDNDCILKYGKDIPLKDRTCEYVGLAKMSRDFLTSFKHKLNEMIDSGQHSSWWEDVIYSLSSEIKIPVLDVEGKFWSEIDYYDDYLKILKYVNTEKY